MQHRQGVPGPGGGWQQNIRQGGGSCWTQLAVAQVQHLKGLGNAWIEAQASPGDVVWCRYFFWETIWNHGKPWKSLPTLMNRKPSQPVDISLVQHQVTRTCRLIVSIHLRPLDAEQQLLPFATVKMTHWMQLCNTTSQGRTKLLNDAIILPQLTWFCLNLFDGAGKYWKMWRTGLDIQLISWLSRMKYNSNRINNGNIFSICFKHDA